MVSNRPNAPDDRAHPRDPDRPREPDDQPARAAASRDRDADYPDDGYDADESLPPLIPGWAMFWNRIRIPVAFFLVALIAAILTTVRPAADNPLENNNAWWQTVAIAALCVAVVTGFLGFLMLLFGGFGPEDFESDFDYDDAYDDEPADELDEDDDDAAEPLDDK